MSSENGANEARTPVEAVIQRRADEETAREHYSRLAKLKFGGGAILSGLAAGGAVLLSSGVAELPAAASAVGEGLATAASIGLFGGGLVDLRLADNASRHSSRLVQALASQELAAGKFIRPPGGPGGNNHDPAHESPVPKAGSVTDVWAAQEH